MTQSVELIQKIVFFVFATSTRQTKIVVRVTASAAMMFNQAKVLDTLYQSQALDQAQPLHNLNFHRYVLFS